MMRTGTLMVAAALVLAGCGRDPARETAAASVEEATAGRLPEEVPVRETAAGSPAASVEEATAGRQPDEVPVPETPVVCVEQATPAVEIVAEPKSGKAPITVKLRAKLVGLDGPLSYHWNFGDGGESAEAQPQPRRYPTGKFNVILKVTDARGKTYRASVTVDSGCPGC